MENAGVLFKCGLFALSGDGIHNGHLDIITRAAAKCERLIVSIASNLEKDKGMFGWYEREQMAKKAIALRGLTNVEVKVSHGLTVDVYFENNCDVYFRGVRNQQDREAELKQERLNRFIQPGMNVMLLETNAELELVSSTALKGFLSVDVLPMGFAPTFVTAAIERRVSKEIRIGVVGRIASGKTTFVERLKSALWMERFNGGLADFHGEVINFDELIRTLYAEKSDGAQAIRERLAELFGSVVLTPDRSDVNRVALKSVLFLDSSKQAFNEVNKLTRPHVNRLYRTALRKLRESRSPSKENEVTIVLVEGAMLVEHGMTHLVSHRIVSVESDTELHARLMESRHISKEAGEAVLATQWSFDRKDEELQRLIRKGGYGFHLRYDNAFGENSASIKAFADKLLREVTSS